MAKHTPGPWAVCGLNDAPDSIVEGKGWQVCFFYPAEMIPYSGREKQEHAANANLIAAAPEMYEALQAALPVMEARAPDFNIVNTTIRAILAKIEGE